MNTAELAHHHLAAALYDGLFRACLATPSITGPDGTPTGGWTLRADPLIPGGLRFDWLYGIRPDFVDPVVAAATGRAILTLAEEIATGFGYRVAREGTGLFLTPQK